MLVLSIEQKWEMQLAPFSKKIFLKKYFVEIFYMEIKGVDRGNIRSDYPL